jgi:drug/metabolite transporter (DMT)-like permease
VVIVTLVLLSALLHAMWNAGLRLEADKDRAVVIAIAIATVVASLVAGYRLVAVGPAFATWESLGWTAVAGLAEALYFAGLGRALALGPLGPVYTVSRGGAVLVVWPVSIALWGEPLTALGLAGSGVVLGGLILSGAERGAPRAAIAWAVACAVGIAGYHLAYKAALDVGGDPPAVFALSLGLASVLNIGRLGRAGRREARALLAKRWARLVLIGTICSVAFLLLMWGLSRGGGAGLVLTLRNTSVVFATGFAAMIGDRPGWRQIAGSVLVAAGAILLAAS